MKTITVDQLRSHNACEKQVSLFRETFGESVTVSLELAEQYAEQFDFNLAANNLLQKSAWVDYIRISIAAWVDYIRISNAAYADYRRIGDTACADYLKIDSSAYADYRKICATTFAHFYLAQGE